MKKKFLVPLILSLSLSGCSLLGGLPSFDDDDKNVENEPQEIEKDEGPIDQASFTKFVEKFNTEGCSYYLSEVIYKNDITIDKFNIDYKLDLVNNGYQETRMKYAGPDIYAEDKVVLDGHAYIRGLYEGFYRIYDISEEEITHEIKKEQESIKIFAIPSDDLSNYEYDPTREIYTYNGTYPSPVLGEDCTYTYDMEYSYDLTGSSFISGTVSIFDNVEKSTVTLSIRISNFVVGIPSFSSVEKTTTLVNKEFNYSRLVPLDGDPEITNSIKRKCDNIFNYSKIRFGTNEWEWSLYTKDLEESIIFFGRYEETDGIVKLFTDGYIDNKVRYYYETSTSSVLSKTLNNSLFITMDMPIDTLDCTVNLLFRYPKEVTFEKTEATDASEFGVESYAYTLKAFADFYYSFNNVACVFSLEETKSVNNEFVSLTTGDYLIDYKNRQLRKDLIVTDASGETRHDGIVISGWELYTLVDDKGYSYEYVSSDIVNPYFAIAKEEFSRLLPAKNYYDYTENEDGTYSYKNTVNYEDGDDTIIVNYDLTYDFNLLTDKNSSITGTIETINESTGTTEKSLINISNLYAGENHSDINMERELIHNMFICVSYEIPDEYKGVVFTDGRPIKEIAEQFLSSSIMFKSENEFIWTFYYTGGIEYKSYNGVYAEIKDNGVNKTMAFIRSEDNNGFHFDLPNRPVNYIWRLPDYHILYEYVFEVDGVQYKIEFKLVDWDFQ